MRKSLLLVLTFLVVSTAQAQPRVPIIGCFLSEETYYVLAMEKAFWEEMARQGLVNNKNVKSFREILPPGKLQPQPSREFLQRISQERPDLLVAFGRPAAVTLQQTLGDRRLPVVFAGVTDPVGVGLIKSFDSPSSTNFTGVAYFIPPPLMYRFFGNLLPDYHSFCCLYDPSAPQDMAFKELVERTPGPGTLTVKTVALGKDAAVSPELLTGCQAFFGWYGLYTAQERLAKKHPDKIFIGSNISQLGKGALATISPSDASMGEDAARMVAAILLKGAKIEEIPPAIPSRFLIGLDLKKAKELGLAIPPKMTAIADVIHK